MMNRDCARRCMIPLFACLLMPAAATQATQDAAAEPPDAPEQVPPAQQMEVPTRPGLRLRIYEVGQPMDRLWPLQPEQTPNVERLIPELALEDTIGFAGYTDHFRAEINATLRIAQAGDYAFRLRSDDGAILRIDGKVVANNDGAHPMDNLAEGAVRLEPGDHALHIDFFENEGDQGLLVEWKAPGQSDFAIVGGEAVWIDPTVVPVVSAGPKRLLMPTSSRPGDIRPLESAHPGWRVVTIRQEDFEPQVSGLAFLPDGRLVLTTMKPPAAGGKEGAPGEPDDVPDSAVYILEGVVEADDEADRAAVKVTKVADGLFGVAGVCILGGSRILVTQRDGITELIDADGDGFFETHKPLVKDAWGMDNFHHFTFSLIEKDGFLYTALSTTITGDDMAEHFGVEGHVRGVNGPNPPNRGSIVKIDPNTGAVEFMAGGLRTPNGLVVGPDGELFVTDNQGAWLPANKLIHIRPGRFYGHFLPDFPYRLQPGGGHPSPFQDQPVTPPALWLPHSEAANSPTEPLLIPKGPFAGQFYIGDVTLGGIARIQLEKIGDTYQGAAFRFTQGLEAGVNRLVWGPDGAIYAGMIGRGPGGNWHWRGTLFGLQKLIPTGQNVLEMHSLSATPDGFVIRFTKPIEQAWLADPDNYRLEQWTYKPTPDYGGPKIDLTELKATSAEPATDGLSVRLRIPGLKPGYVVYFHLDPTSMDGEPIWSTEAWYTLNEIPGAE